MQSIPLLPKGGGLIQVDIGGHPPLPTGSHTAFHLGSFFYIFGSQTSEVVLRPLTTFFGLAIITL
jgi:hypothetical protein